MFQPSALPKSLFAAGTTTAVVSALRMMIAIICLPLKGSIEKPLAPCRRLLVVRGKDYSLNGFRQGWKIDRPRFFLARKYSSGLCRKPNAFR